jgi:hypothetical protein
MAIESVGVSFRGEKPTSPFIFPLILGVPVIFGFFFEATKANGNDQLISMSVGSKRIKFYEGPDPMIEQSHRTDVVQSLKNGCQIRESSEHVMRFGHPISSDDLSGQP